MDDIIMLLSNLLYPLYDILIAVIAGIIVAAILGTLQTPRKDSENETRDASGTGRRESGRFRRGSGRASPYKLWRVGVPRAARLPGRICVRRHTRSYLRLVKGIRRAYTVISVGYVAFPDADPFADPFAGPASVPVRPGGDTPGKASDTSPNAAASSFHETADECLGYEAMTEYRDIFTECVKAYDCGLCSIASIGLRTVGEGLLENVLYSKCGGSCENVQALVRMLFDDGYSCGEPDMSSSELGYTVLRDGVSSDTVPASSDADVPGRDIAAHGAPRRDKDRRDCMRLVKIIRRILELGGSGRKPGLGC